MDACWRFETFARNDANRVRSSGPVSPCATVCGDGVPEGPEGCDDGNSDPGDGCRADCTVERCGDAIVDVGEICDDGNTSDGDCCSADCTKRCVLDVNDDTTVRVSGVGDSNTAALLGWPSLSWTLLLEPLLPAGWITQNFGIIGLQAHGADGVLGDALALSPDVVVIALGTNDIGKYTPQDIAEAILALRERARRTCYDSANRSCIEAPVMSIPPVFPGTNRTVEQAAAFNAEVVVVNAILQIAVGTDYIDSFTGLAPEHFLADGGHLNTEGQAIRAERVWAWLSSRP